MDSENHDYGDVPPLYFVISGLDRIKAATEKLQTATAVLTALADSTCGNELADPLRWVNKHMWNDLEVINDSLLELKAAVRKISPEVDLHYEKDERIRSAIREAGGR